MTFESNFRLRTAQYCFGRKYGILSADALVGLLTRFVVIYEAVALIDSNTKSDFGYYVFPVVLTEKHLAL